MNGNDLAQYLRFLYGDERGLGLAQAAHEIGTKPERLREMLADKRPVPGPWSDYLRRRVMLLGRLTARRDDVRQLFDTLRAPEQRQLTQIDVVHTG